MSEKSLDRVLAALVVAMAATGLLSLRVGSPDGGWLFVVHGVLGGSLLVTVAVKLRRSIPRAARARRWGRLALGSLLGGLALAAVGGGFAWVASGRIVWVGPWTLVTLHALLGLLLLPVVVVHLWPHRWRLLRPGRPLRRREGVRTSVATAFSRRSLVAMGLLALGALGLWGGANVLDRVRGGERRFTGSRWLPSGGIPPPTTFFGEPIPSIDLSAWQVSVRGRVERPGSYTLHDLRALPQTDRTVVLDCTGGWAMETAWRGVPLRRLLESAGADDTADVVVRSVTGWSARVRPADVDQALLAMGVAGGELPLENGAPLRLVVANRRGLDWVKWVSEVEVT